MPRDHVYPSGHESPKERQQKVLAALAVAGEDGLTSREFAMRESPGGDVSAGSKWGSCFTNLHQDNEIKALVEQRDGHHVYVLKEHLLDRDTWPGYRHKGTVVINKTIVIHCKTCTCEEES